MAELYLWTKLVHIGCVTLSLTGFAGRGALMLSGSPLLRARFVRVAPHVVDTLLLLSGAALAWMIRQAPFVDPWLTAKLLGLVAYIGLGTIALRRGRTRPVRAGALAAALVVAGYIVWVALTKDPTPWS